MEDDGVVAQNKMRMALNTLRSKECIKDKRLRMLHRHYPLKKLTDRILLFPIQFQIQMGFSQLMFHLGIAETRSKPLPGRYNRDDNFYLNLEDITVMEVVWLSIQEHGAYRISRPASFSFENNHASIPGQTSRLGDSFESTMSHPTSANSREVST
jgi:hypothetical protein